MLLNGTMQQITDQILINHIFITIRDTYNTIIDTLQHLPEEQATVDYVVERLEDFEQLALKNDIGDPNTAGTSGSAMYAKGKGGERGKRWEEREELAVWEEQGSGWKEQRQERKQILHPL